MDEKTNILLVESFQRQFSSNNYNIHINNETETFNQQLQSIPPRSFPICSPPLSLPEDDESTPFSLMPAYSCNSSPLCIHHDEVGVNLKMYHISSFEPAHTPIK